MLPGQRTHRAMRPFAKQPMSSNGFLRPLRVATATGDRSLHCAYRKAESVQSPRHDEPRWRRGSLLEHAIQATACHNVNASNPWTRSSATWFDASQSNTVVAVGVSCSRRSSGCAIAPPQIQSVRRQRWAALFRRRTRDTRRTSRC